MGDFAARTARGWGGTDGAVVGEVFSPEEEGCWKQDGWVWQGGLFDGGTEMGSGEKDC